MRKRRLVNTSNKYWEKKRQETFVLMFLDDIRFWTYDRWSIGTVDVTKIVRRLVAKDVIEYDMHKWVLKRKLK
jgi:DNA repair protein RadC